MLECHTVWWQDQTGVCRCDGPHTLIWHDFAMQMVQCQNCATHMIKRPAVVQIFRHVLQSSRCEHIKERCDSTSASAHGMYCVKCFNWWAACAFPTAAGCCINAYLAMSFILPLIFNARHPLRSDTASSLDHQCMASESVLVGREGFPTTVTCATP